MMNKKLDMESFGITIAIDKAFEDTICKVCPIPESSSNEVNRCRYCTVVNFVNLFGIDKYDMEQMLRHMENNMGGDR